MSPHLGFYNFRAFQRLCMRSTYAELDAQLGWKPRTFHSVFGGWRSHRGTHSPRPFRICPPELSPRGAWDIWLDEEQAPALR